jgi:hypothetical protein
MGASVLEGSLGADEKWNNPNGKEMSATSKS